MNPTHYAPIIIRSDVPNDWERKFLASIIAMERKGKPISERQANVLRRIVRRFQEATMRDDEVVENDATSIS